MHDLAVEGFVGDIRLYGYDFREAIMMPLLDYVGAILTGRSDFSGQFKRYRETLGWLALSLLKFNKKLTSLAIVSGILGGILKAGALTFLLYYAHRMERGGELTLLGHGWDPRSSELFYLSIGIALVLLVCGAVVVNFASHAANRLSIEFAVQCSKRVLISSGGRPFGNPHPSKMNYPVGVKAGVTGMIGLVRGVKPLLQLTNPLVTLLYSLTILFYMNTLLSLGVLVLAMPTLLLQYQVSYQSVQNEKKFIRSRARGMRRITRLLNDLAQAPRVYPSASTWIDAEYRDSAIGEYLQCFYRREMAQPKSAFVSDMLLALLSFLVVIYLGSNALTGEIGWASFVAYLLFARISLMALRGVLVSITGFARHYPRVRRTFEYFESLKDMGGAAVDTLVVTARGGDRIGDRRQAKLKPGIPFVIFTEVPLTRFNLYAFADALVGRNAENNSLLRTRMQCISGTLGKPPGGSLNELLRITVSLTAEQVTERLETIGLDRDTIRDIDPDASLSAEIWRRLPRSVRARILLEQGSQGSAPLVLVDNTLLSASQKVYASKWFNAHADTLVGVVSGDLRHLQDFSGSCVLLMAPDRSISVASAGWCRDNAQLVSSWIRKYPALVQEETDDELLEVE